jgi:predicted RecA/RadA family phage recombinase
MAKNIRYDRAMAVPLAAPYAVTSGQGVQVGRIFGVALADAASGDTVAVHRGGVAQLAKATGQAWTVGQAVYWDNTNRVCTTTAGTNLLIGAAFEAAATGDTTGWVLLDGAVRP